MCQHFASNLLAVFDQHGMFALVDSEKEIFNSFLLPWDLNKQAGNQHLSNQNTSCVPASWSKLNSISVANFKGLILTVLCLK